MVALEVHSLVAKLQCANTSSASATPELRTAEERMERAARILALEYPGGEEHPRLVVQLADGAAAGAPTSFTVTNSDLVKVIRRRLASGDLVVCILEKDRDDTAVLVGLRAVAEASSKPGRPRHLNILQTGRPAGANQEDLPKPGELDADLARAIREEGDPVFHAVYYSDTASVLRWHDVYYYWNDGGTFGPFPSLRDALRWSDSLVVQEGMESIKCIELTPEELARSLEWPYKHNTGITLELNGETWALGADLIWRRVEPT